MAIYATTRVASSVDGSNNQDITFPEIDFTPVDGEALVIFSMSTTLAEDAQQVNSSHCRGVTNGTEQYCSAMVGDDDRLKTLGMRTFTRGFNDAVLCLIGGNGGLLDEGNFVDWIDGGVRINWATRSGAKLISVTIIAGEGVGAYIEHRDHDTAEDGVESFTTGLTTVTAGMIMANRDGFDASGTLQNDASYSFGYFDGALNQAARGYLAEHGDTLVRPVTYLTLTKAGVILQDYSAAPPEAEVTSVASGTVQVTKRNAATNFEMVLVALELPVDAWAGTLTQPNNVTGTHTHDEPGFPMGLAVIDLTQTGSAEADTIRSVNTAGAGALCVLDMYGNEYSMSWSEDRGGATGDTVSKCRSYSFLGAMRHTGAVGIKGTYEGQDVDGFDIDYTNIVGAVTKEYPALVIQSLHCATIGATQGAATASVTVVQQVLEVGAVQGAATASLSLVQQSRVTVGATQGAATASLSLAQQVLTVGATQGAATASLSLSLTSQLTVGATQGAATASLALVQQVLTVGAVQGAATASLSLSLTTQLTIGATQGAATASLSLVQQALQIGATQGAAQASLILSLPTQLAIGATQGAATASLALVQQVLQVGAVQGAATASLSLSLPSQLTVGAVQGAATASLSLVQQVLQVGATQGGATASLTLSLPSQLTVGATQGAATASLALVQQVLVVGATQGAAQASLSLFTALASTLMVGARQGAATASVVVITQVAQVGAVQGAAQASLSIFTSVTSTLTIGATQTAAQASLTVLLQTDLFASRTCLAASYMRLSPMLAERKVASEFAADHDRRTDMAATRNVRTSLAATRDTRTDLAARKEACP